MPYMRPIVSPKARCLRLTSALQVGSEAFGGERELGCRRASLSRGRATRAGQRARGVLRVGVALLAASVAMQARAQTEEIQVYDAQIGAPGVLHLTWHDNFTPSGPQTAPTDGPLMPQHTATGV